MVAGQLQRNGRTILPNSVNKTTFFLAALALSAGACWGASRDIKWSEDVKLHDGTVIVVKRRIELGGAVSPAARRGHPRYHELCYAEKGIYWRSKPEYEPELFDIVAGKAYVRVPLRGCSSCMLHDFPGNNAVQFVWDGNTWVKIDRKDLPPSLRFNLLSAPYGDDESYDAKGHVTLLEKRTRDASIYSALERANVTGVNERPRTRDLCERCRNIQTSTDRTAGIFLPAKNSGCSW